MTSALALRDRHHPPTYSTAGRHRRGRHARPQPAVEALAVAAMLAAGLVVPPTRALLRGDQILALILWRTAKAVGVVVLGVVLTTAYLAIGEGRA